jgi:hypothetical protein
MTPSPPSLSPRARRAGAPAPAPAPLTFPGIDGATPAWVRSVAAALTAASWAPPAATGALVPPDVVVAILDALARVLDAEPTVVDVS